MEKIVLPLASKGSRAVNSIVDSVIILFLWILLSIGLFLIGFDHMLFDENTGEEFPSIIFVIFLPIYFLYYFTMEARYQRTVGKYITKTKVLTKEGAKPSVSKVALRSLCRLIPFEYLSFLASPNGIHDLLSETRVVKWYA